MTEFGEAVRPQLTAEVLEALNEDDLTSLIEILPSAFSSIEPKDVAEYIPRAIDVDGADVIVARSPEGKLVSVALVNIDYGAGKLRGRIDDVATHEDYKRQGYAGATLDKAVDWFRVRGIRRIALTSNNGRQPAHRLYESRGFRVKETNQFQLDL